MQKHSGGKPFVRVTNSSTDPAADSAGHNPGLAWTRRRFLGALGLGSLAVAAPAIGADDQAATQAVADSFDREVKAFMRERKIPGGALAVVKDHRLVYTSGYGWADRENEVPVKPDSLFRIASVSKPITAVAIMKLVENGKLQLDAKAFDVVKLPPALEPDAKADPRLQTITIRQLLHHTAGWDNRKTPDPMFRSREIANIVGVICPPEPRDIIRYMLGRPLDFDPGTEYAYSNFGYCVLGRVIEEASGMGYEEFVQQQILKPMDITRMRIGATLPEKCAEGEVHYYMTRNTKAHSVFGAASQKVPWPYGGFCLESMDAHGGWIASAVDLARLAAALVDPRRCPVLDSGTLRSMYEPPAPPVSRNRKDELDDAYYGLGWMVRPVGITRSANYWHSGSLPGTFTLLVRRWDGLSWAALFNQRSENLKLPDAAIDIALHRAADRVQEWPPANLFEQW